MEPHGRQRNPFDKRFCPALWLERAFLDGDFTGVIPEVVATLGRAPHFNQMAVVRGDSGRLIGL